MKRLRCAEWTSFPFISCAAYATTARHSPCSRTVTVSPATLMGHLERIFGPHQSCAQTAVHPGEGVSSPCSWVSDVFLVRCQHHRPYPSSHMCADAPHLPFLVDQLSQHSSNWGSFRQKNSTVEWSTPPVMEVYQRGTSEGSEKFHRVGRLHLIPGLPCPPLNTTWSDGTESLSGCVLSLSEAAAFWGLAAAKPTQSKMEQPHQLGPPLTATAGWSTRRSHQSILDRRNAFLRGSPSSKTAIQDPLSVGGTSTITAATPLVRVQQPRFGEIPATYFVPVTQRPNAVANAVTALVLMPPSSLSAADTGTLFSTALGKSSCFTMVCHVPLTYRSYGGRARSGLGRCAEPDRYAFLHPPSVAPLRLSSSRSFAQGSTGKRGELPRTVLVYAAPEILSAWVAKWRCQRHFALGEELLGSSCLLSQALAIHEKTPPSCTNEVETAKDNRLLFDGDTRRVTDRVVCSSINARRVLNQHHLHWSRVLLEHRLNGNAGRSNSIPRHSHAVHFSPFPSSAVLLRNRKWRRDPFALAQEMQFGAIELF